MKINEVCDFIRKNYWQKKIYSFINIIWLYVLYELIIIIITHKSVKYNSLSKPKNPKYLEHYCI